MSTPSITAQVEPATPRSGIGGRLPAGTWAIYLAAMALLTGGYVIAHATGPHWLNTGPVYNLIGGASVVALVIGARNNSPRFRLPWYLLAVGMS